MKRAVIAKFGMQQIKRQITNDTLLVQRNTLFTKRAFVVIFMVTQCAYFSTNVKHKNNWLI